MVVEEDSVGFSTIEVKGKHAGPSGLRYLQVLESQARTPRAVGARGWRIRQPGNDRSKIHAHPAVPSLFHCTTQLLTVI